MAADSTIGAYLVRDESGRFRFDLAADELGPTIALIGQSTVEDDRRMLRVGDRVKLIDGNDAFGLELDEARALVKRAGPMLKLYVVRGTDAPSTLPARTGIAGQRQGVAGRRGADEAVSEAAELLARSKLAMQRPSVSAERDASDAFKALEGFGTWLQTSAVEDARRAAAAAAEAVQQSARSVSETAAEAARRIAEASGERIGVEAGGSYSHGRFGGGTSNARAAVRSASARAHEGGGGGGQGYGCGGIGSGAGPTTAAAFGLQCVCDMRGFKCPLHPGRELWRNRPDFAQAMAQGDRVPGEDHPDARATPPTAASSGGAAAPELSLIDLSAP
ncbi:hypothetical protein KFE25_009904 [Diacronema lutheri]|uniref:PDZ domain-containing protein n=1 Tax=Diacronema lutheri TaxID=2081491 RepID=A0A8J5XG53_DIALT|nr:hypothetical protein KFE25_009904 [Diacronema lutheri]